MGRFLSSVGIGAATVDTVLPTVKLTPGETVEARVELEGGSVAQEVGAIYFVLLTRSADDEAVLSTFEITDPITLDAGESRVVTADVAIPLWTPLTRHDQSVWLKTGLDIDWAVDPSDEDEIEVVPEPFVSALLEAVDDLGFEYSHSDVEESPWLDRQPILQKLVFDPGTGTYADELDALSVSCVPGGDHLEAYVEVDEHEDAEERGEVEFDKQEIPVTFESPSVAVMRRRLVSLIDRYTYV